MAAVERAVPPNEQQLVDRDRGQITASSRFTPVNGSNPPPARMTSFRPQSVEGPGGDYRKHSVPKDDESVDQIADKKELTKDLVKEQSMEPRYPHNVVHPRSPIRQIKRKRSTDTSSSSSPGRVRRLTSPQPLGKKELPSSEYTPRHGRHSNSVGSFEAPGIKLNRDAWTRPHTEPKPMTRKQPADPLHDERHGSEQKARENVSESPLGTQADDVPHSSENGSPKECTPKDGKKQPVRKRNFSQRTKTGCHTCRERKKKCDETKPICNNCTRGNFTCRGYGPKNGLETRASKPPPLQMKEVQAPIQPAPYYTPPSRVPMEPWINGRPAAPLLYERPRLPPYEHESPAYAIANWPGSSINEARAQSSPYTHPHEALASQTLYTHGPALDRSGHQSQYASANPLILNGSGVGMGGVRGGSSHQAQYATTLAPTLNGGSISSGGGGGGGGGRGVSGVESAQAIQIPPLSTMTEKEKMLIGKPYKHYNDEQLVQERIECKLSLERFNKACLPSAGSTPRERGEKLKAILQPKLARGGARGVGEGVRSPDEYPYHLQQSEGSCGSRVIVEPPFSCEYGYNIHIGDDVLIQSGCVMLDACKITIGNRTMIGPNVKFYGMTAPMDPGLRRGTQGVLYGGSITIEEDCFIGGDVIILPNRTIKRGSFVGAGTVVSKDVQASTVVAGNPMRVLRDISPSAGDTHKRHIQMENDASIAAMIADRYGSRDAQILGGRYNGDGDNSSINISQRRYDIETRS